MVETNIMLPRLRLRQLRGFKVFINNMDLAKEEQMKKLLLKEIDYNRNKLKHNLTLLKSRQCENKLLTNVVQDYESFYDKLRKKEEQHKLELEYITKYLKDIIETNDLTDFGLTKVKTEQHKILGQLHTIRNKIYNI